MDRDLDPSEIRSRRLRRAGVAVAVFAAGGAALSLLTSSLRPSLALGRVRVGRVDRGPLDAVLSASGTVVPETERVLASPIDARVLRVLVRPGTAVKAGQPLVQLDTSQPALVLARLGKELRLKETQAERARLALEGTLSGLESQVAIRTLQLATYGASLARNRKLFAEGLVSEEQLRQSELDEARTRLEMKQLAEQTALTRRSAEAELSGLASETEAARRERDEAARELDLAAARTDRDGVVTSVVPDEGAAVRRGDVLARVADLTAFRVEALVPDLHAARLRAGLGAAVRVDETRLPGRVARVQPAVQNGLVALSIALETPAHPLLRPNLRVEVELVTDSRAAALRVPKGSFSNDSSGTEVWVLRGDEAVRTAVRLGISGAQSYEVLSGLSEGDEVVLSDMSAWRHLPRMKTTGRRGGSR